ncbi:hypothetical protein PMI26_00186 [Pseudomonas sp. GM33]|nr:TniQ family protein [Pseudomonas sp. GM33]EJM49685.1 hypothetical protein PMI26_00186 [Pseudomonas sp. GM33]
MGLLTNKKYRRLRGFPQPYSDETLSSWLFRCAVSRKCVLTIDAVECYVENSVRNGIDYDFSFGEMFKTFCSRFGIDYSYCKAFFAMHPKDIVMSIPSRNSFCRQCLDEDVKLRSAPYWRRAWCRFDVAYCSTHKTLLTTTRENYGLYRSWESFAHFSGFDYERRGDRIKYEFATLKFLGFKVQNWLYTKRNDIARNAGATKLIRDLLSSFLSLRTDQRYCGIARVAFSYAPQVPITHRDYHYSLCMYHGARNSNSTQRKAALIMLGVVLGFYDELQLQKLGDAASYSSGLFPSNPKEAGATVLELLSEPEREWYASLFLNIPPVGGLDIYARLEEFLSTIRGPEYDR